MSLYPLSIDIDGFIVRGMKTLADMLNERISSAYGGNKAEFARANGFSQQAVNTWTKGKVTLPQIDARRRLAKELGISHLELLVVLGEISEEEASLPEDPRSDMVRYFQPLIDAVSWNSDKIATVKYVLRMAAETGENVE